MIEDEDLLLEVLNSAPLTGGRTDEQLVGPAGAEVARRHGGAGDPDELARLRQARDALHEVVRGSEASLADLASLMGETVMRPSVTAEGVRWELAAPAALHLAARTVLAWDRVQREMPGRLRPCANSECNLFLIDRSRPGTARWCSMATCGNRAKARAHAQRVRTTARGAEGDGPRKG